ncbi:MAG: hypothetical protein ACKVQS_11880 [Fimbriimonadaceae bacterium]
MKGLLAVSLLALGSAFGLSGCAPKEEAGDYKVPAESEYKKSDQVPERAGRTKAEAGGEAGSAGRSEGG